MSVEQDKAADIVIAAIQKEHGEGSIRELGSVVKDFPCIPTGILSVDNTVLGIGGLPKGRIIEIYGPESSGKTTLALTVVASAQASGGKAAFIDVEHALDPAWATVNGVDVEHLLVSQPDNGEQALEIVEALVRSAAFDVVVVDSVAALVPKAELEGDMGDSHMGLQARLMSQAMRKLTGIVSKSNTCLIFINQVRDKIGVMFGSPETTTGGRALKFYSSVRLDVRRLAALKDGDTIYGNRVKIKAAKNKIASPFRETEVDLLFKKGFDKDGDMLEQGVLAGVVDKAGAWFSFKGERLGQGKINSSVALAARIKPAELAELIKNAKKAKV